MSPCTGTPVCGSRAEGLVLTPPPPGLPRLARRLGSFDAFVADLIARVECEDPNGVPLAESWDLAGDPRARQLARLWAYVADGVSAYAELTAGEAYLGTAIDWSDLRRLAAVVGYKPQGRVAAQGWVRADVERGAAPTVPAGTRVQAPGRPDRPAQTFEVVADTALRGDWSHLTATWPFEKRTRPDGATIRFAVDPGFRDGDTVLFVDSKRDQPQALARVVSQRFDIGTSLVTFDRDLEDLVAPDGRQAWAYAVLASAGTARRLEKVVSVVGKRAEPIDLSYKRSEAVLSADHVILEQLVPELSVGSSVAVASWGPKKTVVEIERVLSHAPVQWEVAPGSEMRVSRVGIKLKLAGRAAKEGDALTLYVLGPPVRVTHLVAPAARPSAARVRIYPGPAVLPPRLVLETVQASGERSWEVFGAAMSASQELGPAQRQPGDALVVDLDGTPAGELDRSAASGNLLRVRHGKSATAKLGSGDASVAALSLHVPDAPVAYDPGDGGEPVSSLELRVDGVRWDEAPSLYGTGTARVYSTRLQPDGGLDVQFGDRARPATGRDNITVAYRVGGGTIGEVRSGEISVLLGRVRGVKKLADAGPTSGGADQDDEHRLRQLAPARARALGRVVSLEDAVDMAAAYPGVTHAAGWQGAAPDGGASKQSGLYLAFARAGADGVRAPLAEEVRTLSEFLDSRRDATVALHVCAAVVTRLALTAKLAVDPARVPAEVEAAAAAALADPEGPLAERARSLGQALDPSDLYAVIHAVPGVLGIVSLTLDGASLDAVTRRTAQRHELLLLAESMSIQAVPA